MPTRSLYDLYTVTAATAVVIYYGVAWTVLFRGPKAGTLVPLYEPPSHLSPAELRYAWKRRFDDRTFWAAVLSLVAKGLVTLKSDSGVAEVHVTPSANLRNSLPSEEDQLLRELRAHSPRKGMRMDMLDARVEGLLSQMADLMRKREAALWFQENRSVLLIGEALSFVAVVIAAQPRWQGEWFVLLFSGAVVAPAAYYLSFLILRIHDLYRTGHEKLDLAVFRRSVVILAWIVPCVAAMVLAFVELVGTFGWPVIVVAILMTLLDVGLLHFRRTLTPSGRKLLDQIEGFRLFLKEVEQAPLSRPDAPRDHAGNYERFLPYAVALEVEQAWCDRFLAMSSTQNEFLSNGQSFYLGMWDGKPVEIVYRPTVARHG